MKRTSVLLLGLAVSAVAGRSWLGERALMDSARAVPPKFRAEWLHEHGEETRRRDDAETRGGLRAEADSDSGLRLVSKWGRGPAAEVTGKDTLVVLTLGSEVALLSFAEPDSPVVLSEIQFPSLTAQSYLADSLLYTSSSSDLEIWNVANPKQPVKVGQLGDYPVDKWVWMYGGFWIRDTFLYYISRDTFRVISIANSADLRELGHCVDSGTVTTGTGNTVIVNQNGSYAFVDVSNPASPHQVSTYPCGRTEYFSPAARGNLVCASYEEAGYPYPVRFITLDISNPSSPRLLAKLNNVGGYGIFLDGPLAFVSGRGPGVENPQPFQILSIADSAHPAFIDSCRTTFDYPWAVWENVGLERAFVANRYGGLAVVDIHNLNNPVMDTAVLRTGSAVDVHVDGDLCYVAGETDGFRLLDVTDPTQPVYLSALDTSLFTDASNYSLTARDSFAFVGWRPPALRVVSVTDPLRPQMVAACSLFNPPEDMVLRDSLIYVAEDGRLEIVNIGRPRQPRVVGMCGLPDRTFGMCIRDSLAYVANVEDVSIVDIAQPANPHILDTIGGYPNSIDVSDTFMFVVSDFWLSSYSVANPLQPRVLDSVYLSGGYTQDVLVLDSIAYCGGWVVQMVNVRDPGNLRVLTSTWTPPTFLHRLEFWDPYVYAACTEGGICVLETCALGVAEASHQPRRRGELSVRPSPSRTSVVISGESDNRFGTARVLDVAGRTVLLKKGEGSCNIQLDVSRLPAGLYFVELINRNETIGTCKFIRE